MPKMTKITLPVISFNYEFKTKKEARQQEAIRAFMRCINDNTILNEIKVEMAKKSCKRCPKNKCKNYPVKGAT